MFPKGKDGIGPDDQDIALIRLNKPIKGMKRLKWNNAKPKTGDELEMAGTGKLMVSSIKGIQKYIFTLDIFPKVKHIFLHLLFTPYKLYIKLL